MDEIIEKYYKKYNYPSVEKLYNIIKIHEPNTSIKRDNIKNFLSKRLEYELFKIILAKAIKKKQGRIIASFYEQLCQLDIYDLSKYSRQNKGYKYLLTIIDVFSRKAFIEPMKTKNSQDVLNSLSIIFKKYKPHIITSDSDSAFMSDEVQKFLNNKKIIHDVVIAREDHHSLGIIDRFALTIKTIINKSFIINDNTNWINHIEDIIKNYNNTPHSSLDGLTPNEAQHDTQIIPVINKLKHDGKASSESKFKEGDTVRYKINKTFRKGTEPKFSDEILIVEKVNGRRILLSNGKIKLESNLLKTGSLSEKSNPIDIINKENKRERIHKQNDIIEENIIEGKRKRQKNRLLDDYVL